MKKKKKKGDEGLMGLKTRMELCKKVSSNKTKQCIKKEKKKTRKQCNYETVNKCIFDAPF